MGQQVHQDHPGPARQGRGQAEALGERDHPVVAAVDRQQPDAGAAQLAGGGEGVEEGAGRRGEGVQQRVHARRVAVLDDAQHRAGLGAGRGRQRPAPQRLRDRRPVAGIVDQVQVRGQEALREGGGHGHPASGVAEAVRPRREEADQLPGVGVAAQRQHEAHPGLDRGVAERQRDRRQPDAHRDDAHRSRPNLAAGGDRADGLPDRAGVVRPEPFRTEAREVRGRDDEPRAREPRGRCGQLRIRGAGRGEPVDEDQRRPASTR